MGHHFSSLGERSDEGLIGKINVEEKLERWVWEMAGGKNWWDFMTV